MKAEYLSTAYEGGLIRVIQECGEVSVAVTKLQQYGCIATDPSTGVVYDNLKHLFEEFNDLEHAIAAIRNFHKKFHNFVVPMPDVPVPDLNPPITRPLG